MYRLALAFCALLLLSFEGHAAERIKQGFGLMVTNDSIGDNRDRWRTGSFESSWIFAPDWTGQAPARFGELIELRINGEIVGPANVIAPAALDRRYGQALSFGLHTHFQPGAVDYALGVDAVVTGSQVGLDNVQDFVHIFLGGRDASPGVLASQLSNGIHANAVFEAGRRFQLGTATQLRPFLEARAGTETLARVGFDLTFGHFGSSGLLVRTPTSGQRLSAVEDTPYSGFSLLLGADVAYVDSSIYIASNAPVRLEDYRARARAGLHWRSQAGTAAFYGVTWLSEEFNTQPEGQVVGSLQLRVKF
ncbi:MAG: lipid A-modifier LpxR family protein [Pseudomonadota bacterium]